MKSTTTDRFRRLFRALDRETRSRVRAAFRKWMQDPGHPSLHFKKVGIRMNLYSARVDLHWRALAVKDADAWVWFWVGPHDEYDKLVLSLNRQ